ncbi:MAG: sigma-70 family RNA polymerase sigma factor [Polyangiales bacterium]
MAPEVFRGKADASSDLYSLGVTMTEAAIGKRLFPSPTIEEGLAARSRTDVKQVIIASRDDLPDRFAELMAWLTSGDPSERPVAEEVLDAFEEMVGQTTTAAELALGALVTEAAREKPAPGRALGAEEGASKGAPATVPIRIAPNPQGPAQSTASVLNAGEELVHGIVKRVTLGLELPTDAREEFVAEGRLGLLEAHRAFDRGHPSAAHFLTFAFPRVHRRVREAFSILGGVPRGVNRAAKKNAIPAREQDDRGEHAEMHGYVAHKVGEGADDFHVDPFTGIGLRLEKNAVRAAIERLPDARQRQVLRLMYIEGFAQSEVCKVLRLTKSRISRIHKAGVETVQKLLFLGSALEKEHIERSLASLDEPPHRDVLQALYRDRLDYPGARSKLGVGATELEELHQAALEALIQHRRS